MFKRAVLAIVLLVTVTAATTAVADENYNDFIGVVISPTIPPTNRFEMFTGHVERGRIDDVDGMQREACIIHLETVEMPNGQTFPLDEDGRQKILLDDGMTFVTIDELIDMVDVRYCAIMDQSTEEVA